jgi:hypothetical protein
MKLNYDAKSTMVAQGWRKGGARVAQRNFYNGYNGTIVLLRHGARWRKMAQTIHI